jgi:4-hydroxybenzoate polyprenyltransferase
MERTGMGTRMPDHDQLRLDVPAAAAPVRRRRSRTRSYLLLARVSNLPTVWTNVLAGAVAAGTALEPAVTARLIAALSLFYTAGMFLNDAFDREHDRRHRPERAIPSGDVSVNEVFGLGAGLLGAGMLLLLPDAAASALGLLLAMAIVYYDYSHKGRPFAPLVMGACRGLVYAIAAAGSGELSTAAVTGGFVVAAYVAGLSVVARRAGGNAKWLVPVLIAGISIVDAIFITVVSGSIALAGLAVAACALTLLLQRWVPGD